MSRIRKTPTGTAPSQGDEASTGKERGHRREGGYRLAGSAWVVTTALVLLALVVVGSAVFAAVDDVDGPPTGEIVAHVAGALAGLALQRLAGRARLPQRVLAVLGIIVDLGLLLWFFWWR